MVSTEVKRTIVKSPPELWEQVSDQETLMRHLGEFGEVRITRSEPEKIVEWETDQAQGKVQMKPSGWGTQVLLSVTRELPEKVPAQAEAPVREELTSVEVELEPAEEIAEQPSAEPAPAAGRETSAGEPVGTTEPTPEAETPEEETQADASTSVIEPTPAEQQAGSSVAAEQAPRRRFFSRLFKRRRDQGAQDPTDASEPTLTSLDTERPTAPSEHAVPDSETSILERQTPIETPIQTQTTTDHGEPERDQQEDPVVETGAESVSAAAEDDLDLAAELAQAEQLLSEQTAVVLTSMLDRLGAAHHRPFSRG